MLHAFKDNAACVYNRYSLGVQQIWVEGRRERNKMKMQVQVQVRWEAEVTGTRDKEQDRRWMAFGCWTTVDRTRHEVTRRWLGCLPNSGYLGLGTSIS